VSNELNPENIRGASFDLELDVGGDLSVRDVCEGVAATVLRINATREAMSLPKMAPVLVRVRLEAPAFDPIVADFLRMADATAYRAREPFFSPEEVRMYFQANVLEAAGIDVRWNQETLDRMAEAVISRRAHCNF
jgi:D-alanyl-D-alanine carboxypeptidase